jgi:hypothetical protein
MMGCSSLDGWYHLEAAYVSGLTTQPANATIRSRNAGI